MLKKVFIIISIIVLITIIFFLTVVVPWEIKSIPSKDELDTRIISYNIKYASDETDVFIERKDLIVNQIKSYEADIICLQEANYGWMNDISGLPIILEDYNYVGVGRDDGKTEGEYAPIFYLKEKYHLIDSNTIWLSETPNEVSIGWDASTYRIVTYATLKDVKTDEVITVYNTHLDHIGNISKEKSIELLLGITATNTNPYIITGDFNITSYSTNYQSIIKQVDDTYEIAKDSMKYGTINYNKNSNLFHFIRIDYIFTSKEHFTINNYRIDPTIKIDNNPVSDHFPVIVDFKI